MICSMTGYSSISLENTLLSGPSPIKIRVTCDIRSVNSRFLDLTFKLPDECRAYEAILRENMVARLMRGKVELRITLQLDQPNSNTSVLNEQALESLLSLENAVLSKFSAATRLSVSEILQWPHVLATTALPAGNTWQSLLLECSKQALDALVNARSREGEKLKLILLERINTIRNALAPLVPRVPELMKLYQQKLVDRLQEALGIALSEKPALSISQEEIVERIRQEIAIYGTRIDIDEELSRLTAHLEAIEEMLHQGGTVGKRLDFIIQELNREANTLGAKAASQEISDTAIMLKLYIEQMREQVQNLE